MPEKHVHVASSAECVVGKGSWHLSVISQRDAETFSPRISARYTQNWRDSKDAKYRGSSVECRVSLQDSTAGGEGVSKDVEMHCNVECRGDRIHVVSSLLA